MVSGDSRRPGSGRGSGLPAVQPGSPFTAATAATACDLIQVATAATACDLIQVATAATACDLIQVARAATACDLMDPSRNSCLSLRPDPSRNGCHSLRLDSSRNGCHSLSRDMCAVGLSWQQAFEKSHPHLGPLGTVPEAKAPPHSKRNGRTMFTGNSSGQTRRCCLCRGLSCARETSQWRMRTARAKRRVSQHFVTVITYAAPTRRRAGGSRLAT